MTSAIRTEHDGRRSPGSLRAGRLRPGIAVRM